MSKRAQRRELRRLRAFERKHATELDWLRRRLEATQSALHRTEMDRQAVATKLREMCSTIEVTDRMPGRFITPVHFEVVVK